MRALAVKNELMRISCTAEEIAERHYFWALRFALAFGRAELFIFKSLAAPFGFALQKLNV